MKKINKFLLVGGLIILTGCGKKDTLTCSKEQPFSTATLNTEIVTTFKKGYVTESETTIVASFDSEDAAASFEKNYTDKEDYTVNRDGSKVTVKNVKKVSESSAKAEENSKEKFKQYLEDNDFICK